MRAHEDIMHEKKTCMFIITPEQAGRRLDAVLAELFPELGLRARRRLWEWCAITVNGVERLPAYKVVAGQEVLVMEHRAINSVGFGNLATPASQSNIEKLEKIENSRLTDQVYLAAAGGGFAALFKPHGLPSAALAGGGGSSVERWLQKAWAGLWNNFAVKDQTRPDCSCLCAANDCHDLHGCPDYAVKLNAAIAGTVPLLCNRLDTATSGLLLVALGASPQECRERLEFFRACERRGEVSKKYLALVHGAAPQSLLLDRSLDTDERKQTKVLDYADMDKTRHTAVTLRQTFTLDQPGLCGEFSLLELCIWRGARHQIRAHLAAAGFPIVGDALYGVPESDLENSSAKLTEANNPKLAETNNLNRMYLHHFELALPGFFASCLTDWRLPG